MKQCLVLDKQRRSQKFAKRGARQRNKSFSLGNRFLALYSTPVISCPREMPGHLGITPGYAYVDKFGKD